ncbi:hypothetical protein [Microbulbifer sp. 2205BS26-8]|uniref:hypothetical protein n=1 Tax=Microbulbifer sp. 2205BS26-8 TaxID=3064386 RepID=UPI00273FC790|nr:hypothetical protein [Microbulbifer sp. 2205BS26-8]MDP5210624.1 hypothetical protein [Microbulbifer sp. 2205BS26-8]
MPVSPGIFSYGTLTTDIAKLFFTFRNFRAGIGEQLLSYSNIIVGMFFNMDCEQVGIQLCTFFKSSGYCRDKGTFFSLGRRDASTTMCGITNLHPKLYKRLPCRFGSQAGINTLETGTSTITVAISQLE